MVLNNTGHTLWMPQAILKSTCPIDITYFPFDEQECKLKFSSWTYNGYKLDIVFLNEPMFQMGDYIPSNEWGIIENTASRLVEKYDCCPEPYPGLYYTLKLKRRVAFYSAILILPCALLSLLTLIIFWVPPESPAKLQLGKKYAINVNMRENMRRVPGIEASCWAKSFRAKTKNMHIQPDTHFIQTII